jgi:peptidoglycan/LPS O-acetylase OafA/YrhL
VLGGGSAITGLFIMLSGFMMHYAYADADGALRTGVREIWIARVARLWPVMLAAHVLAIPFTLYGQEVYSPLEAVGRAALSIVGLQAWVPHWAFSFNGPAWTISVLLLCYALFPLLVRAMRHRSRAQLVGILLCCWLAMLVPTAMHFARLPTGFTPASDAPESLAEILLHAFPPFRLPDFIAGVALGRLFALRGAGVSHRAAWLGVAAGGAIVLFLASPRTLPERFVANGLLSPLFWLVLLGVASAGDRVEAMLTRLRIAALGDASLSMFLLHMPPVLAMAAARRMRLISDDALLPIVLAFVPAMLAVSVVLERRFVSPAATLVTRVLGAAGAPRASEARRMGTASHDDASLDRNAVRA